MQLFHIVVHVDMHTSARIVSGRKHLVVLITKTAFVMSESLRAFKENMKLGRFKDVDPDEEQRKEVERERKEREEEEKARTIQVGDR